MNSQEAFEAWAEENWMYISIRDDALVVWQSACAYQRKHDAEICRNIPKEYAIPDYGDQVVTLCAQAIEEQG